MSLTFDRFKKRATKVFEKDFNDKSIDIAFLMDSRLKKDLNFDCLTQIEFYMALEEDVGFEFKKDIPTFDGDITFKEFITFIFKKQMAQLDKRKWKEG